MGQFLEKSLRLRWRACSGQLAMLLLRPLRICYKDAESIPDCFSNADARSDIAEDPRLYQKRVDLRRPDCCLDRPNLQLVHIPSTGS
jgi:hypothetical protein